jgi:phage terminase large subunit-like protein
VLAGKIVAGHLVRLACERHLRDLKEGPKRGLKWDKRAAAYAIEFFSFLSLAEGEFAGTPFKLQPFQEFIIGSLFGWKGSDGYRRFRTAYVEQGKGNGKSPLAAGVGLYGMLADNEPSAEIYSAATRREQAGILFRDARLMAESSPTLARVLKIDLYNLAHVPSASFFRAVSSEHRGLDGKRPHIVLIDEVHEHPTPMVVDKMRAGTKGRRQAMIFEITNSGYDRNTVCYHHHNYSEKVLAGVIEDDSWFAYVCQLDPCDTCRAEGKTQPADGCPKCDDWRDEKVWPKANPNLGVSITLKYLREQVREAIGMPTKEGIVKRLNFCIWTEAATHAIPMDKWDLCARPAGEDLAGRECFAGLDIGSTSDFTALVRLFPHDDAETVEITNDAPAAGDNPHSDMPADPEKVTRLIIRRSYTVRATFWLPERPRKRDERMAQQIEVWRRQGLIRTTPGEVVDYEQVSQEIKEVERQTPFRRLAIDRAFQGNWIAAVLADHFGDANRGDDRVVVAFPQGIISLNGPFREWIELIRLGRLYHDGDPVLRWMASNCAAEQRGGLIKPSKEHSTEKIDGITAGVMGLGVAMLQVGYQSVYESRGLLTL